MKKSSMKHMQNINLLKPTGYVMHQKGLTVNNSMFC